MKGQQEAKERTSGVVSSASREGLAEPDCSGGCCSRVTFISVVQVWQSCMARHKARHSRDRIHAPRDRPRGEAVRDWPI